jgi:hypothetical protein
MNQQEVGWLDWVAVGSLEGDVGGVHVRPVAPLAWYATLVLRYGVAFALAWLTIDFIWAREWAFWVKVIVEFVVVNGLIVWALVLGPITYRGYVEEERRLVDAALTHMRSRVRREDAPPSVPL